MTFPFDINDLPAKVQTSIKAKDFAKIIAVSPKEKSPNAQLALAWALKEQADTGVHIDDVHEDAEDAEEIMVLIRPKLPQSDALAKFEADLRKTRRKAKSFAKQNGLPLRIRINPNWSGAEVLKKAMRSKSLPQRVTLFSKAARIMDPSDPDYSLAIVGQAIALGQKQQWKKCSDDLRSFVMGEMTLPPKRKKDWEARAAWLLLRFAVQTDQDELFLSVWDRAVERAEAANTGFGPFRVITLEVMDRALDLDADHIARACLQSIIDDNGKTAHCYNMYDQDIKVVNRAKRRYGWDAKAPYPPKPVSLAQLRAETQNKPSPLAKILRILGFDLK